MITEHNLILLHPDSDLSCSCTTIQLMGQPTCSFLQCCASVLQLFATYSSTLRSRVYAFHDNMHEDALNEYDEAVHRAMTECATLPIVADAETHAASHIHEWRSLPPSTAGSCTGSPSHNIKLAHTSSNKAHIAKTQKRGSFAPWASPQLWPTKKIPKTKKHLPR